MNLRHNPPRTVLLSEMRSRKTHRAAKQARISGTPGDRAIAAHGFVAARSCGAGYTALPASHREPKSPWSQPRKIMR